MILHRIILGHNLDSVWPNFIYFLHKLNQYSIITYYLGIYLPIIYIHILYLKDVIIKKKIVKKLLKDVIY